jgi:hypothetical protein
MQVANGLLVTAIPSAPAKPVSRLRAIWDLLRQWWLRTPLTALLIYCLVSVWLQENYPFSHFPMYSNPSAERPYYMVTDGDGQPLPIGTLTGITCPKVGKIYRTECQEVANKLKLNKDRLPPDKKQAIGEKMFAYLRAEATNRKQSLPGKLQLIRMEISYQDGQIIETPEIIAQE